MKRQLNYWSKPNKAPETELVNVSLSVEDNNFTIRFGRPGSIQPITQIVFDLDDQKSFDLRKAFDLSGAAVFQDEMDERIYFSNIARSREEATKAQNFAIVIGWSVLIYIVCMFTFTVLFKLYVISSLCFSLSAAIIFCILFSKKVMNKAESNE